MHSNWYPAPESLQSVLAGIWTIQTGSSEELRAKVLPDGTPYLVFQRGETRLLSSDNNGDPLSPASLSGPRTRAFDVQLAASSQVFIVQLSSSGGTPVLGLPMKDLTDRCEDLEQVVDRSLQVDELSDRIMNAPDHASCIRLLHSWVSDRAGAVGNRQIDQLVTEMKRHAGNCGVASLAAQLNCSRRHLGRIAQQELGLSPKVFGRIVRFDRAVQLGRIRPKLSLAQVASRSGYSDQAHMNREFRQLGGITPSDLQKDGGSMIW